MKTRLFAVALLAAFAAFSMASDSADEMLTKIKAVKFPAVDQTRVKDKDYVNQYMADYQKAAEERNKLILDFYKSYPDNEEADKLMNTRWSSMAGRTMPNHETILKIDADIDGIIATAPAKVKQDGMFWKARYAEMDKGVDPNSTVDAFINAFPSDPRGAQLLQGEAENAKSIADKKAIYTRIVNNYKDSPYAKYAPGILRQLDGVGKPVDLTFTDAISGKKISIGDLKGKVVLLDFWATWCGPCVARMPDMKKLYADLHPKGLEVLGISLDQPEAKGGLTSLKDYVAKNDIQWPQYYQGNFWSSEFSTSWGINSIPCVFLIDKNGNLAEVTYPEDLEKKVSALLGN